MEPLQIPIRSTLGICGGHTRIRDTREDHRLKKKKLILGTVLGVSIVWLVGLGYEIWTFGAIDQATRVDCIIVLGSAIEDNKPSPVFEQRIQHGIQLFQNGFSPTIIFTGGIGDGERYSESRVAQQYAIEKGIPSSQIFIEEQSRTTQQNLAEAHGIMKQKHFKSAILVSDPLHMKRSLMMAQDLGMTAFSSPTPTSMYRSWKPQSEFLFRELYFWHHYRVTGH
jgi:uncharacterized SAM-binding protein YcdF (DUF218 family)